MNLKFMLEGAKNNIVFLICLSIFCVSIFVRSMVDIGADTGFYIFIGEKIAHGGKYYYDFFESNFPLSFYIYALEYWLSYYLGVNTIIMSEIVVNLLGILSLWFTSSILRRTDVSKRDQGLLLVAFFFSYFLRIGTFEIGDFGTKVSFLLVLLYPYLAFSLLERGKFGRKDLLFKGLLMGLIPCFKPHYAIFIVVIEFYQFFKVKSWRFFLELDKLLAVLVMFLYIDFMLYFTPEYFEFMVPMWSQFYVSYADLSGFLWRCLRFFDNRIILILLLLPAFLYLRMDRPRLILLLFCLAGSLLILLENAASIDQEVVFFAVLTPFLLKMVVDLVDLGKFDGFECKFIFGSLLIFTLFSGGVFFVSVFNLVNIWWFFCALIWLFYRKRIEVSVWLCFFYVFLSGISIYFMIFWPKMAFSVNFCCFLVLFFVFELFHRKAFKGPSWMLFLMVFVVFFKIFYLYFTFLDTRSKRPFSAEFADEVAYNIKKYAPEKEDSYLAVADLLLYTFPLNLYLEKEQGFKYGVVSLRKYASNKVDFSASNLEKNFVFSYLFEDFKRQILDKNVKIVFFNNLDPLYFGKVACNISGIEYYLGNRDFAKLFLRNFAFKGRILQYRKKKNVVDLRNGDINAVRNEILYDFEVYVRK